eukprot:TRINITY_DN1451_c0_g2_i1.p1 TRINITY_DN1451_c0_g2~~TRINITY_DN1451_c0_g2_i1.p1  ORF type:complete len:957 (+),score=337.46 TRINITY_DN1451_c0_g2_i1:185-2872(+)
MPLQPQPPPQGKGKKGAKPDAPSPGRNKGDAAGPATAQATAAARPAAPADTAASSLPSEAMPSKDKRRYLLDVDAVPIIDSLVMELLKRRPGKTMVVPVLKEILQAMDGSENAAAHEAMSLIEAAASGTEDLVAELLQGGADANAGDDCRRTALHSAAQEGHIACVKLLCEHGGNVNARDKWGTHPLDSARQNGRKVVVEYLLQKGALPGRGKSRAVSSSTDNLVNCMRLCSAAGGGDMEGLRHVLDSGVSAELEDYDFRTPLHLAAESGHLECVELLISRGAKPNARDRWGGTPLSGAMEHGHQAIADLLKKKGGDATLARSPSLGGIAAPPEPAKTQRDCLFDACQRGDLYVVQHILGQGMDVNLKDYDMRRPLHLACEEGHVDVVRELIQRGALLNVSDRWGTTPLQGALYNSQNDIVAILKDHGADAGMVNVNAPVFDFSTRAMRFFDSTLSLAGLPKEPLMPVAALVVRLSEEYGFNLGTHEVLRKEIAGISRRRTDEKVSLILSGTASVAFDKYTSSLPASYPQQHVSSDQYVISDEFIEVLTGRSTREGSAMVTVLRAVVFEKLPVPSWNHFVRSVGQMFEEVLATENDGATAQYIPELRDADSSPFAVSICTALGQECHFGEYEEKFSAQSTAKTFAYTMALQAHGAGEVHSFVGQEPSGRAFNDFALTRDKHPFNPVTNAGSIVTCTMVEPKHGSIEERMTLFRKFLSDLSGGMDIRDCLDVYRSEQKCAYNNYALANFMRAENTFPPHVTTHSELSQAVNFYLRVCSTEVSTKTLARIASTYANCGSSPLSGRHIVNESDVRQTLQILYSCGMYDFSGEWACTIGMPAKSGVSGNIMIIVPGVLGMCVWSPKLDNIGNSVRGIRFAKLFSEKFRMSLLSTLLRGR